MKKYILGLLLLLILGLWGCSDSNPEAGLTPHPADWYTAHRATSDINACGVCHGFDLKGSATAPSCFSASFDGRNCHANGPGQAPHPLDGSYLNSANHGPDAKADLTICQGCHSDNPNGGPGSNPRFNVGINSQGGNGCEACHGAGLAHPAIWAGPENDVFHYSAANIQNACTLCHGVALDGVGGNGVSCLECHAETTNLTLDCTACHAYPPDGTADVATVTGVAHRNVAVIPSHGECSVCHGVKQSSTGGEFSTSGAYTSSDHWDGNINMNSDTQYNETNFGCDAAGCHPNDIDHRLTDSGLPVVTAAYGVGGGGGAPHAVDGSFLLPANHGPAVKGQNAAFPNGLLDCQVCHASAGTDNPSFNVGIVSISNTGCEGCHPANAAHPTGWYDLGSKHSDITVANLTAMCVLCHDTSAGGPASAPVGPACATCHPADPLVNSTGCSSCHNLPPDGSTVAGNVRPNRAGSHTRGVHISWACNDCHFGVGYGTADHFDQTAPATVVFNPIRNGTTLPATYEANGTCSNVSCHGGDGSSEGPW